MTAVDSGNTEHIKIKNIIVNEFGLSALDVNFTFSSTGSLNVAFKDVTVADGANIKSWLWDFGDGKTSTVQNPSNTYSTKGMYTVKLSVTDSNNNTLFKEVKLNVTTSGISSIDVDFDFESTDFSVKFTDKSISTDEKISSWLWNFGDGDISSLPSPTHIYQTEAKYTVRLTIKVGNESYFKDKEIVIVNNAIQSKFFLGSNFSYLLTADGRVYAWGNNQHGRLGLGTTTNIYSTPQKLSFFDDSKRVKTMVTGMEFSAALTTDGAIYVWGRNQKGQLGLTTEASYDTPQLVNFFKDKSVKAIYAGNDNMFALLDNNTLYSWGWNDKGQLGRGATYTDSYDDKTIQKVSFFDDKPIINLSSSIDGNFVLALVKDGTVYAWGENDRGQLGINNKVNQLVPQKVAFLDGMSVKYLATGLKCGYALLQNGTLYSWGDNSLGQLGINSVIEKISPQLITAFNGKKIASISTRLNHIFAVQDNGDVYVWGGDTGNELGITAPTTCNGTLCATSPQQQHSFFSGKNVDSISTFQHNFVIDKAGKFYMWGSNTSSQLGNGNTGGVPTPTLFTPTLD